MTTETSTQAVADYVAGLIANASSLGDVRTALGLGSMSTQNANAVAITGGALSGVSAVAASLRVTGGPFTVAVDGAARSSRLQLYGAASATAWAPANQAIYAVGSYTGTGQGPYSVISLDDSVTNTQLGVAAIGVYIAHNIVAGAGAGNRTTLQPTLSKNAPTSGTNPLLKFYTPFFSQHYINSDDGGTSGNYVGDHYGGCSLVQAQTGGKWLETVQGFEIDVAMQAGSSAKAKSGLLIASVNSDAVRGSNFDAMLSFTRDSTCSATWKNGICFGYIQGLWPFGSDSILIGTYGTGLTAGTCIDFSAVTASYLLKGPNGFTINGAGGVNASSLQVTNTTASGAVLGLLGNGSTTPNKYIRAKAGNFDILDSTGLVTLFTVDDTGATTSAGISSARGLFAVNTSSTGAIVGLGGNGSTTPNKYIRAKDGVLHILSDAQSVIFTLSDTGRPLLNLSALQNAANDSAAATAGVAVGEVYRNDSVLMVRVS